MHIFDFETIQLMFREMFLTVKMTSEKLGTLDKIYQSMGGTLEKEVLGETVYLDLVNDSIHNLMRDFEDHCRSMLINLIRNIVNSMDNMQKKQHFEQEIRDQDKKLSKKFHSIILQDFAEGSEETGAEMEDFAKLILEYGQSRTALTGNGYNLQNSEIMLRRTKSFYNHVCLSEKIHESMIDSGIALPKSLEDALDNRVAYKVDDYSCKWFFS